MFFYRKCMKYLKIVEVLGGVKSNSTRKLVYGIWYWSKIPSEGVHESMQHKGELDCTVLLDAEQGIHHNTTDTIIVIIFIAELRTTLETDW